MKTKYIKIEYKYISLTPLGFRSLPFQKYFRERLLVAMGQHFEITMNETIKNRIIILILFDVVLTS